MITEFKAAAAPLAGAATTTEAGKGGNTIVWLLVIAAAAYIGYKFVYLPYVERQKKQAEAQPQQ